MLPVMNKRKPTYVRLPLLKKSCLGCGRQFDSSIPKKVYCHHSCFIKSRRQSNPNDSGVNSSTSTIGAIAELIVSSDLLANGWAVFRALSPSCFCDLIAVKDGETRYLEVRSGIRNKNGIGFMKRTNPAATEFAIYIHRSKEIVYMKI